MKIHVWLIGGLFAGLALTAAAEQAAPAPGSAPSAEQSWQQHWQRMQEYRQRWQAAKTPEERQKLREEHWKSMQEGMAGGCPMMGRHDGMGMHGGGQGGMMGHGCMAGAGGGMSEPTAEQLDRHIDHMEKMLEQLRAHREMLGKQ